MINFDIYLKSISFGGFLLLLLALPIVYTVYSQIGSNGKKVKPLLVIEDANRPSLSYDGTRVTALPEIGLSEVHNIETGKKLASFRVKGSESTVISPDGNKVIIFGREITNVTNGNYDSKGVYSVYEVDSGKKLSDGSIYIFKEGKRIGFGKVWNEGGFNTKNITSDLTLVAHRFFPENFSNPDPQSPAIILGDLEKNTLVREYRTEDGYNFYDQWNRVSMTPDGKFIAAYRHNIKDNYRNKAVVWDAETGKIVFDLPFYRVASLSDDGTRIVIENGRNKDQVEIWDVPSGKRISTLTEKVKGKKVIISRSIISPDGKIIVTTGNEEFYFWDVETGRFIASQNQVEYSDGIVKSVTFSGDGKRLAVGSDTEVVTVWSVDQILKNQNQSIDAE